MIHEPHPGASDSTDLDLGFEDDRLASIGWDTAAMRADTSLRRSLEHERTSPEPPAASNGTSADDQELEQLRSRLALIKARAAVLRDPGWLEELTPGEQDADRAAAAQIRAMRREQSLAAALAHGRLGTKARRVDSRLAKIELADRLWGRKALARRNRLLDPASRLAGLHRAHVASSTALIAVALAGIVWTANGVHDAIVGPDGSPLAYLVEPIFSIPLLVIMAVTAQATGWNRAFPPPAQRGRVVALEVFLLAATVAMNTVSVLPGTGTWHNTATLLAHLLPPMLIVVAVVLQPLIAGFLADILTTTATETATANQDSAGIIAGTAPVRLSAESRQVLQLVAHVTAAIASGELTEWASTGLPSISAIQRHLRCEKRRAQLVWDALRLLHHLPPHSDIGRTARKVDAATVWSSR